MAEKSKEVVFVGNEHAHWDEERPVEVIVSSGHLLAVETAQKIARASLANIAIPVYGDPGVIQQMPPDTIPDDPHKFLLREPDRPTTEPIPLAALQDQFSAHRYEPHWHYSDEENYYDVWIRAKECLDYLARLREQRIVVVTHVGLIKACLARMMFDEEQELSTCDKLEAYHAFAAHTWIDNSAAVSVRHDADTGKWRWLITK